MHAPGNWATADGYDAAIAYLRTLPPDTIVAAHPDDANAVPLRCRRDVLVSTEIALPIHEGYYAAMRERLDDAFDLLYGNNWTRINRISRRTGATVFLLDVRRLQTPDARTYPWPFAPDNVKRIAEGKKNGFALLNVPPGRLMFSAGDMRVISLRSRRQ